MTFISLDFWLFCIVTILVYFLSPVKYRWGVLLAASLYFYAMSGVDMLIMLLVSSLIVYGCALWMEKVYAREDKQKAKQKCRFVLGSGAVILIGVLALVKMSRYMPENLSEKIIVPVGISYYTFSLVGYLADVYWRKQKAEHNYLKFALFAAYFPKILQGPISRYKNLAPQFVAEGDVLKFDYKRVCFGLQLMLWGVFKKIVIADRLALFVNNVYQSYETSAGSLLVVATMLAAVQLYCDFSGYMDIAAGISQVFGIELEQNFNHPFFSKSAAEFWRRWHITLGTWFKDYVYMPIVISPRLIKIVQPIRKHLGARAGKAAMVIVPSSVVWLLTGIWHGTGKPYVVWGIYWGALIILSTVLEPEIKKLNALLHINTEAKSFQVFRMVRTFLLFAVGRMITIPNSLPATTQIVKKIFTDFQVWKLVDGTLYRLGLSTAEFNFVILMILLLWGVSLMQEKGSVRERLAECNIVFRWIVFYIAIIAIFIFGVYGSGYDAGSFVYMEF